MIRRQRITLSLIAILFLFMAWTMPSVSADEATATVTFDPNNGEGIVEVTVNQGESLTEALVPFTDLTKDSYDFLGWFYGEAQNYELYLPLTITQDLHLRAKWGNHTPPSPVNKEGYRLIFQDEFDNSDGKLSSQLWVDKYLSSWTREPALAKPTYTLEDGVMSLQIFEETRPWAEEYDGQTVVSGFTTGNRNALHNWNRNNEVRNPVETEITHINQYGYYEIRAKTQPGSSRHAAWWLVGFEDRPEQSAEIDIFEVLGNDKHGVPRAFHAWNDPSNPFSGGASTYRDTTADFHHEWHTYGFDWQEGTGSGDHPDRLVFYVDGKEIGSTNTKIDYPMIQLFSLYEKRAGGWTGPWEWMPYPNSFDIDYVRVYKKIPEGYTALPASELKITEIKPSTVSVVEGEAALTTYTSAVLGEEGTVYTEPNLPNTLSYVDVVWNDGVITQEFVKWSPITESDLDQLNRGQGLEKRGQLVNLKETTPGLTEAILTIEVTKAPPKPPYSSMNLGMHNNQNELAKLFNGNYDSNSGEFVFASNTLPEGEEVSITYNFDQLVQLHSIELTTNYGNDQGIKAFKLAVYDAALDQWVELEEEYTVPWTSAGNSERGETLVIDVNVPKTTQVKMVLTDVGLRWVNKMAMRELSFADHDVLLEWDALELVIDEADQLEREYYTEASFDYFLSELQNSKALFEKDNVTQRMIDEQVVRLQEAIDQLEEIVVETPVDKTVLLERLEEAKSISNADNIYTVESFNTLTDAIKWVESQLDTLTTEQALMELIEALDLAMASLESMPLPEEEDNQDSENTEDAHEEDDSNIEDADQEAAVPPIVSDDNSQQPNQNTSDESNQVPSLDDVFVSGETLPHTATSIYQWLITGLLLIVAGSVMVYKRKRYH